MAESKQDTNLHLEIAVREVYSGDGKIKGEMRVFCPDREHLVAVEECIGCSQWRGLNLERGDRGSSVKCAPISGGGAKPCGHDQIGSVMTPNVICLQPQLSVQAALDILLEKHISGAPVVGPDGGLLGIVSRTDLLRAKNLAIDIDDPARLPETIDDVMTPLVFALQETASVSQAAGLMAVEGVHRILVVSPKGELIGILSALDVMRWLARRDGYLPGSAPHEAVATPDAEKDTL